MKRILLVEDQILAAKIIILLLNSLDCHVDLAEDGKTALSYYQSYSYDLIFMDIGLPDMNGFEVTKRIRLYELTRGVNTPIIALTANLCDENKQYGLDAGMNEVLSKPLLKDKAQYILDRYIPSLVNQ